MKLLLDTHIFIWLAAAPERLTPQIRKDLEDPDNTLLLSVVSIWEMQIKHQLGKLELPLPLRSFVRSQLSFNDIQVLPLVEEHIWALGTLPLNHRDPFDRILIAQANAENCVLASMDKIFQKYPVKLLSQN
ncbi:MAG: type II toxin-antitoxin system VapC family toxin [Caldilineae bacterium]|nr:MAG: type II toxin-antitoxin system VapC family toxin [Caldilineae bacterium]